MTPSEHKIFIENTISALLKDNQSRLDNASLSNYMNYNLNYIVERKEYTNDTFDEIVIEYKPELFEKEVDLYKAKKITISDYLHKIKYRFRYNKVKNITSFYIEEMGVKIKQGTRQDQDGQTYTSKNRDCLLSDGSYLINKGYLYHKNRKGINQDSFYYNNRINIVVVGKNGNFYNTNKGIVRNTHFTCGNVIGKELVSMNCLCNSYAFRNIINTNHPFTGYIMNSSNKFKYTQLPYKEAIKYKTLDDLEKNYYEKQLGLLYKCVYSNQHSTVINRFNKKSIKVINEVLSEQVINEIMILPYESQGVEDKHTRLWYNIIGKVNKSKNLSKYFQETDDIIDSSDVYTITNLLDKFISAKNNSPKIDIRYLDKTETKINAFVVNDQVRTIKYSFTKNPIKFNFKHVDYKALKNVIEQNGYTIEKVIDSSDFDLITYISNAIIGKFGYTKSRIAKNSAVFKMYKDGVFQTIFAVDLCYNVQNISSYNNSNCYLFELRNDDDRINLLKAFKGYLNRDCFLIPIGGDHMMNNATCEFGLSSIRNYHHYEINNFNTGLIEVTF